MRQLKEGRPVSVPFPGFGDLVVTEGEHISEAAYARLEKADRHRFKKVADAAPADADDDTPTPTE